MAEKPEPRELDRRAFVKLAAAAAALSALAAPAVAQTPPPAPAAPAPPPAPEHSGSEARHLTEVLRARYPDRFSEAQWGSIVTDFDGDLASGRRLRAVKLANGDEPDFSFRA
jgi:hypothetical protein